MSTNSSSAAKTWRITAYVMLSLSFIVFLLQRTSWALFDTVFEVCIFHIPAFFSALIYLKIRWGL